MTAVCTCRSCHSYCYTADGGWTLCVNCLDAACTPYPTRAERRVWPEEADDFKCLKEVPVNRRDIGCG